MTELETTFLTKGLYTNNKPDTKFNTFPPYDIHERISLNDINTEKQKIFLNPRIPNTNRLTGTHLNYTIGNYKDNTENTEKNITFSQEFPYLTSNQYHYGNIVEEYKGNIKNGKRNDQNATLNRKTFNNIYDYQEGIKRKDGPPIDPRNVIVYTGKFIDDEPSKNGECKYNENITSTIPEFVYTGELDEGQPNGIGKMIYKNGDTYEGSFVNGNRHGRGIYTFKNGIIFKCQWINDVANGWAEIEQGANKKYMWLIGERERITFPSKTNLFEYYGLISSKYRSSPTITYYPFEGHVREGQPMEKVEYSDSIYIGGLNKNKMAQGFGFLFFFDSGNIYQGNWVNNVRHGDGYMLYNNGNKCHAKFENDQIVSYYEIQDSNHFIFIPDKENGSFIEGKKEGNGMLFSTRKNPSFRDSEYEYVYNGNFINDKKDTGNPTQGKTSKERGEKEFVMYYDHISYKSELERLRYMMVYYTYEGQFNNDKYEGNGIYSVLNTNFSYHKDLQIPEQPYELLFGPGEQIEHYIGKWKNGKKEGKGEFKNNVEDLYIGNFKNNQIEGEGTLYPGFLITKKGSCRGEIRGLLRFYGEEEESKKNGNKKSDEDKKEKICFKHIWYLQDLIKDEKEPEHKTKLTNLGNEEIKKIYGVEWSASSTDFDYTYILPNGIVIIEFNTGNKFYGISVSGRTYEGVYLNSDNSFICTVNMTLESGNDMGGTLIKSNTQIIGTNKETKSGLIIRFDEEIGNINKLPTTVEIIIGDSIIDFDDKRENVIKSTEFVKKYDINISGNEPIMTQFYKGPMTNGKIEGVGRAISENGIEYIGNWKNNNINGEGVMRTPEGITYESSSWMSITTNNVKVTYPSGKVITLERDEQGKINPTNLIDKSGTQYRITDTGTLIGTLNEDVEFEITHYEGKDFIQNISNGDFIETTNKLNDFTNDTNISGEITIKYDNGKTIRTTIENEIPINATSISEAGDVESIIDTPPEDYDVIDFLMSDLQDTINNLDFSLDDDFAFDDYDDDVGSTNIFNIIFVSKDEVVNWKYVWVQIYQKLENEFTETERKFIAYRCLSAEGRNSVFRKNDDRNNQQPFYPQEIKNFFDNPGNAGKKMSPELLEKLKTYLMQNRQDIKSAIAAQRNENVARDLDTTYLATFMEIINDPKNLTNAEGGANKIDANKIDANKIKTRRNIMIKRKNKKTKKFVNDKKNVSMQRKVKNKKIKKNVTHKKI